MEKFIVHQGLVLPLDRSNVDTDAIIPKQYLKSVKRTGFGVTLFDDWRYLDAGEPGDDHRQRRVNPDFILNQDHYREVSILLARKNFGCGSSREHAVWALADYGFRVVIASSFADIFFNNSFKNGLLAIFLSEETIDRLFQASETDLNFSLTIDLKQQKIIDKDGTSIAFDVDPFRQHCLLKGLDDISLTLQYTDDIRAYEKHRKQETPWLFV